MANTSEWLCFFSFISLDFAISFQPEGLEMTYTIDSWVCGCVTCDKFHLSTTHKLIRKYFCCKKHCILEPPSNFGKMMNIGMGIETF